MLAFVEKLNDIWMFAKLTSSIAFILKMCMRVRVASKESDFFDGEKGVVRQSLHFVHICVAT